MKFEICRMVKQMSVLVNVSLNKFLNKESTCQYNESISLKLDRSLCGSALMLPRSLLNFRAIVEH